TKHDTVECHNGDQMAARTPVFSNWPKSCEHCLFSHWRILPFFVRLHQNEGGFMHNSPPLLVIDYVGPAVGAAIFVLVMSLVKDPTRRIFNAICLAGAGGVYLSGGFGLLELLYPAISIPVAYLGLRSYRVIAFAWLMHACWDIVHYVWGNPIWPFMPTSSFGCMIFDALIAVWFLFGAPSIFTLVKKSPAAEGLR